MVQPTNVLPRHPQVTFCMNLGILQKGIIIASWQRECLIKMRHIFVVEIILSISLIYILFCYTKLLCVHSLKMVRAQ